MCTLKISFSVRWSRRDLPREIPDANIRTVTATGENQSPINNMVGKAIVDACVRAGREGRKFRVIVLIPAIPGFAGDLRDDAAAGTRSVRSRSRRFLVIAHAIAAVGPSWTINTSPSIVGSIPSTNK